MDAKDPHFSDYKSDMTYIMNSCGDLVLDQYIRLTGDSCPSVYLHVLPTQHTKGDRDSMLLFFAITNHACDVLLGERILRDVVSQFRTITKDTTPALWCFFFFTTLTFFSGSNALVTMVVGKMC